VTTTKGLELDLRRRWRVSFPTGATYHTVVRICVWRTPPPLPHTRTLPPLAAAASPLPSHAASAAVIRFRPAAVGWCSRVG